MRICALFFSLLSLAVSDATPIRVASFNLRYDTPADKENSWVHRRHMVARAFDFHRFDIVGTQEALDNQLNDLQQALTSENWARYSVGRNEGGNENEHCAIWWRRDRFRSLKNGTFWLSTTPHIVGSRGWDAHLPRIVTWVALIDLAAGLANPEPLFVFNTHLDHGGRRARLQSARMMLEATRRIAGDSPFLITGDFNCDESDPVDILTRGTGISDARSVSQTDHYGEWASFTGWRDEFHKVIDYVFVKEKLVNVLRHGVLSDTYNKGKRLSDHRPVVADLKIKFANADPNSYEQPTNLSIIMESWDGRDAPDL